MQAFEDVVSQHEAIKQQVAEAPNTVHLEQIMALLKATRQAGAVTSSAQAREELRDILRYWGQYLNKNFDVYPDMHLAPFDESLVPQNVPPEQGATPVLESTQPIQVTSDKVNTGFSQLKWVFILMIGMLVLFFVIQVVFPPADAREETNASATPDELMVMAVTETHEAIAQSETAVAASAEPTVTPTPEIIEITATPPTIPVPVVVEHTVAEGETLFSIARQYNSTITAIQEANNLTSETITVGDVLEIEVVPTPETAVSPDTTPASNTSAQPAIPADMDAVIRGSSEAGITVLLVAPEVTAQEIQAVPAGTFVYAVGQTQDGSWLLVELNGRTVRGWVPAAEVNLLYPRTPQEIPVIQTQ